MREKMSGSWPKQARDTAGNSCHPRATLAENRAFWTQKSQRVALARVQANGVPGGAGTPRLPGWRECSDAQCRQGLRGGAGLGVERITVGVYAAIVAHVAAAVH